ncbi:PEP-CTERM sorting domain-containing protein [Rubripirellula sp.]|nr:PEP-CTERM sorting domain-containing protein [Rubripirellula sp.]
MNRFILMSVIAAAAITHCSGGYFDFNQSSYTATQYVDVVEVNIADASTNNLNATDIVRSVQLFTWADNLGNNKTSLAIQIAEVVGTPTGDEDPSGTRNYTFAGSTSTAASTGFDSINEIKTAFSSQTNFESTGASVTGSDAFALLTTDGIQDFSTIGFSFDSADFGLSLANWSLDMTAAFDASGNYMVLRGGYIGDIVPGASRKLDPFSTPSINKPNGSSVDFQSRFAYTITGVYDEGDLFHTPGDAFQTFSIDTFEGSSVVANIGSTLVGSLLVDDGSVVTGSEFRIDNQVVSIAAPGTVPEPASLATFLGLTVSLMASRRRKTA